MNTTGDHGAREGRWRSMVKAIALIAVAVYAVAGGTAFGDDTTIRVVQWNIGHFAMGRSSQTAIEPEESAAKRAAYRAEIARLKPDLLGVSEFDPVFDKAGRLSTNEVFSSFPVQILGPKNNYQCNALFTRFPILRHEVVNYTSRAQHTYFLDCVFMMGTNEVHFVQSHLDWKDLPGRPRHFAQLQVRQLIEHFKDKPRVIISADYNIYDIAMFAPFVEAGYDVVNKGRYAILDNVVVKGFEVTNLFEGDGKYPRRLSDHRIVGCDLKLLPAQPPLRVAVYVDKGARNIGVFRWLEIMARAKGIDATVIDGAAVRGGALDKVDVLVMPGGSSVEEAKSLGPKGCEKVKAFVKGGGRYVGTCAGCCLLMEPAEDHPNMLHMIPFKFGPSGGKADMSVAFNRRAGELAGIRKHATKIRYSEGPVPLPSIPVEDADVEVVATYNSDVNASGDKARPSMSGQAAAIAGTYGKGRLFVLAVHPEYDANDHYILKGAFRFLTGRNLEWDYPQRKRGQLTVGFMCDDSFGVETARFIQRLFTECEFDVIPLNKAQIEDGWLRRVDAVLAPAGARSAKPETGLYAGNAERTKEFLASGRRIFAWGSAAEAAKVRESGVTCVADAEAALAALRALAAEPAPARAPIPAKVDRPIRVGIFHNEENSCHPIAMMLSLAPEYDLKFLAPEDYAKGGLDGLDLVIQPGGTCAGQYRALGEKGVEALRRFVLDGGKYYGVCAGAFLASQPYVATKASQCRIGLVPFRDDGPEHYRGWAPIKIGVTDEGREVFGAAVTNRTVMYWGGPALIPDKPIADTDVKVLGRYAGRLINTSNPTPVKGMFGKAAFVGGRVGKGKVFVSCPHPEKSEANFDLVRSGLKYLTGVAPTPFYLEKTRGAPVVRYRLSDKASVEYLFNTLNLDSRFFVVADKSLDDLPHFDSVVLTGKTTDNDAKRLNLYMLRGGRVVVVCDTPDKLKAAKKLMGATVVKSYAEVAEALQAYTPRK